MLIETNFVSSLSVKKMSPHHKIYYLFENWFSDQVRTPEWLYLVFWIFFHANHYWLKKIINGEKKIRGVNIVGGLGAGLRSRARTKIQTEHSRKFSLFSIILAGDAA